MNYKLAAGVLVLCCSAFAQSPEPDYGRGEVRLFAGTTAGTAVIDPPSFSGGVAAAYALSRFVAITGNYAYDGLGSGIVTQCDVSGCFESKRRDSAHEFMGGFRFSAANRSRITPYVSLTAGVVRSVGTYRDSYSIGGVSGASSGAYANADWAGAAGGGLAFRISPRFGVAVDSRALVTVWSARLYSRTTGGVYFRF